MRVAALLLVCCVASCAEGGHGTDVDFDDEIQPVLNENCLCHMAAPDGTMEADYMTLNPGMAQSNLVGVPSEEAPDLARVEPGDRARSYLWHKLQGTQQDVGGSGDRMPPLASLPTEQIELVGQWIDGL